MLRAFAFALGVALSASALAWDDTAPPGGQAIPALKARVTDTTGTLSATQRSDLEGRLAGWESKTGIQLALLFVATTQPESIEQYAIRVAEAWKLGKKGQDNGALLLIAKNDKKMRLEVGYGLEGNLPDVTARRLLNDTLGPQFRSGRYYEGLTEGIDRIYRVAAGDEKLAPAPVTAAKSAPAARSFRWMDYAV
ncbi:MAG: YgcG family protein, partial [Burkholderiales bacterium]